MWRLCACGKLHDELRGSATSRVGNATGTECIRAEAATVVSFADNSGLLPAAGAWGVAWTRARHEKSLVQYLCDRNVPSFLPTMIARRVYHGRVRLRRLPLFPGYVFFDQTAIERPAVFESRKVADIFTPPDAEQLRAELENIALALSHDASLRYTRYGQAGLPVRVKCGPLKGLCGELVRLSHESRLVISVTFLSKAAELSIDEAFVEPF